MVCRNQNPVSLKKINCASRGLVLRCSHAGNTDIPLEAVQAVFLIVFEGFSIFYVIIFIVVNLNNQKPKKRTKKINNMKYWEENLKQLCLIDYLAPAIAEEFKRIVPKEESFYSVEKIDEDEVWKQLYRGCEFKYKNKVFKIPKELRELLLDEFYRIDGKALHYQVRDHNIEYHVWDLVDRKLGRGSFMSGGKKMKTVAEHLVDIREYTDYYLEDREEFEDWKDDFLKKVWDVVEYLENGGTFDEEPKDQEAAGEGK